MRKFSNLKRGIGNALLTEKNVILTEKKNKNIRVESIKERKKLFYK